MEKAKALVELITPIVKGSNPAVTASVYATLIAMHICRYRNKLGEDETDKLRTMLLIQHIKEVARLMTLIDKEQKTQRGLKH